MKISIFGMGYVGVVSAACLIREGHHIHGVDPLKSKVNDLANGRAPIQEPEVASLLAKGHQMGLLHATVDPAAGLRECDMAWICVGTPSAPDGGINLASVEAAIREIGESLRQSNARPLVVLRSTSLPGTTRNRVIPALEQSSGLTVGRDLHVVFHPEFLREGTAVEDFDRPPKIVVGEAHPGGGDRLMSVYESIKAPRFRLNLEEAELVKYADNLFHATKVTFANEVGALARSVGADARVVADIFCSDTKLNISTYYLRPGFAYGGSCLPKDLRAILRHATEKAIRLPLLQGVLESNMSQIETFVARIMASRPKVVGMVGLAFKPNTDDMRESPFVAVAKRLIGEGVMLRIHDPGVDPARLIGGNKKAVQNALGHLEERLVPNLKDLDHSDIIMINHPIVDADRVRGWLDAGVRIMDLASIKEMDRHAVGYEGICW